MKRDFSTKNDNEVDLFELIHLLWKKKYLIITITILTTLIAAIYAFTAKERWTAKAYLTPPRVEQIQSYLDLKRDYSWIAKEPVDIDDISEQFFTNFIELSQSVDQKIQFLQQTDYFENYVKNLTDGHLNKVWLAEQVDKNLLVVPGKESQYQLSMVADDPVQAKLILQQYIDSINSVALTTSYYEFQDDISELIKNLEKEKSNIELELKIKRENNIKDLEFALGAAKSAGISSQSSTVSNFQIFNDIDKAMLGDRVLEAEVTVLKNAAIIYPYRYYQVIQYLESLSLLSKVQLDNIEFYRYQMMPNEPIQRDAPKRSLILMLGFLLGGVLGIGVVLIRSFCVHQK